MNEIKYVQLEPAAFLTDIDFQMMDSEQRGAYCSIIFYLYCNGGKIELGNNTDITLLSDSYNKLAIISGCQKTGQEWKSIWAKIAHKFQITGNILTHRRVTKEIERVEIYKEKKSEAGKKGMAKRWSDNTDITTVSKGKVSKDKKNIYLNHVRLTKDEYLKLTEKFGKAGADEWIKTLDEGISLKGYKYKSHYLAILKWSKNEQTRNTNNRRNLTQTPSSCFGEEIKA